MLLIAITGPVGAGKSTLLAELAAWAAGHRRHVTGFVAEASGRAASGLPAPSYSLRFWPEGERVPFAERDEQAKPPYRFHSEGADAAKRWADGLGAADVVVLDEFGKLEARGEGHMALWPQVAAARPGAVVVALREGLVEAVEARLGRSFDMVIEADAPGAARQLQQALLAQSDWSRVGLYGGGAGAIEMTLGSALHGSMLPARGLVMASAQAAMLVWAGQGLGDRSRVVWVPFIAAGLKALSPTGNRLRPMLAITVQGLFFAGATRLIGWNPVGVTLGATLVGAWAAAQGIVLQYLLLGTELLKAYGEVVGFVERHWGVHPPAIAAALAVWFALWALVTGVVGALAYRRGGEEEPSRIALPGWLQRFAGPVAYEAVDRRDWKQALRSGARDLTRPVFWLPLAIVAAVLLASGKPAESAFWMAARAATVGFVIFSLARAFDPRGLVRWLQGRGHWGPALAFSRALEAIERR